MCRLGWLVQPTANRARGRLKVPTGIGRMHESIRRSREHRLWNVKFEIWNLVRIVTLTYSSSETLLSLG